VRAIVADKQLRVMRRAERSFRTSLLLLTAGVMCQFVYSHAQEGGQITSTPAAPLGSGAR